MSRMRANVVASLQHFMVRGTVAMALGLSLIFGSLILGSWAGPSASAEGPASVFFGYVFAAASEPSPAARVRAVSTSGVVCGTAEVVPAAERIWFYAIAVSAASQKRGCPEAGAVVQFTLVTSRVDDGQWTDQVGSYGGGESQRLNLGPSAPSFPGWMSGSTNSDGSLLRWSGVDGTPLPMALASIPLTVVGVSRPSASGHFTDVPLSNAEVLATDDLLLVRFR